MFPSREEKINKVYQDEDFIYPTLDQSDEEDVPLQKDEAWNPKIKMSSLGPKMERPVSDYDHIGKPHLLSRIPYHHIHLIPVTLHLLQVRDSVKNIAIEKGLSHAAHQPGSFVKLKSSSKIHKKPRPPIQPVASSSSCKELDFSKDRNRTKKVGNTAKQRLGKILGLKF